MNRASFALLLALTPLLAALQGCSGDEAEASVTHTPPLVLARGVVDVEGGLVSIRPQRSGQLIEITTALGQEVSQGTVLARLQGTTEYADADAARAEWKRARAELAGARRRQNTLTEQMGRVREAIALGAESAPVGEELQAQLDAQASAVPVIEACLAAAEARLRAAHFTADSTAIKAPIDGRIVQVNARLGDVVSATDGPALFQLRPKAALIVRASIPARDIARVHVGATASIRPADDEAREYNGQVLLLGELERKPDPALSSDDFTSERIVDCIIRMDSEAALRVGGLVMVSFK